MDTSYIAIGYECNHNCICCPLTTYDRLHSRLSYEEIVQKLKIIKKENVKAHIVLSGGEPMIHPQFLDIVKKAEEEGFFITVLSNSSQCRNQAFVSKLSECISKNNFNIVTAIHSALPEIHDNITGVQGGLMETLEGLDYLVQEDIQVTIKHIFHKKSIQTLMETFQYLEEHFPPQVSFQFCTMDYSGRAAKNINALFITLKEIQTSLEKVLDYLEEHMSVKRQVSIIESPFCMVDPYYWKYFQLSRTGLDYYIAPNVDNGCLNSHQIINECGSYYTSCQKCSVKQWCPGVWKSAYNYYGSDLLTSVEAVK